MLITSIAAIINVLFNFWIIPIFGANGAALTTVVSEIFVAFCSYRASNNFFNKISFNKDTISPFVGGVTVAIICIFFKGILDNNYVALALSLIVSPIIYIFVLNMMGNSVVRLELLRLKK